MKKAFLFLISIFVAAGCAKDISETFEPDREPIEEVETVAPEVTVIRAGFENSETKSRIEMNGEGSYAKVLWTKGDAIKVIGTLSSKYYSNTFTTEDDGVSSADFSCSGWNPSGDVTRYYAYYPAGSWRGYASGKLGVYIPGEQTAVADGIAEGLNISYASAGSLAEELTFKNIPALLKFRLSGDVVKDLASVKFVANTTIAGNAVIEDLDADQPTYNMGSWFGNMEFDSSVTLNGPFEEDVDYYMAMFPGTTDGFSMIFTNADGEYLVKQSSKTLTLNRSRITDFGTVKVGSTFGDPLVTKYASQTVGKTPVDLVVLPDGFTSDQRQEFETLAASGIGFMFDTEPYKTYKDYFNVYFIWAPSKEQGASITDGSGNIQTERNTAFGSRWGSSSYGDMAADADKVYGYVSAHCPEILSGELTIDEVPILLIINDERYGGRAHSTSSGRTYCQVPYTREGGSISWAYPSYVPVADDGPSSGYRERTQDDLDELGVNTGDWRNTLLHEFGGHSFGRLKDEYWYLENGYPGSQSAISQHSWSLPFGLNVSGYYDSVPWQDLLDRQADLVSGNSLYNRIGVYQGGDTYIYNRWRSEKISCMIDNRQYFSAWQRVLIARRISDLAGVEFDLDAFLQNDDPTDPVRDVTTLSRSINSSGPVQVMPPLAPPELIDNTTPKM